MTGSWTKRLIAVAASALLAAACTSSSSSKKTPFNDAPTTIPLSTPAAFPVTAQRSDGKTLTINQPPTRILSLSPGATETIYAIGAESALAAVDTTADYPAAAKSFPTRVDASQPDIEAIAALKPDLAIVAADVGSIVAKLDGLSIPVLYVDTNKDVTKIDDIFAQIGLLGRITGKNENAQLLLGNLADRRDKVKLAVQGVSSNAAPSVYHELDATYLSASDQTFAGDIYRILHMTNIAGDGGGSPYPHLTQEAIIAANPRLIVLAYDSPGVTVASVTARPGWSTIDAVNSGKVFAIDPSIAGRPGPRIIDALEALAKDAYPTRFK